MNFKRFNDFNEAVRAESEHRAASIRRMVCSECWERAGGGEIKTMGSVGPCCICYRMVPCSGPINHAEYERASHAFSSSKSILGGSE